MSAHTAINFFPQLRGAQATFEASIEQEQFGVQWLMIFKSGSNQAPLAPHLQARDPSFHTNQGVGTGKS